MLIESTMGDDFDFDYVIRIIEDKLLEVYTEKLLEYSTPDYSITELMGCIKKSRRIDDR